MLCKKEIRNFSINLCLTCRCQFIYFAYTSFLGLAIRVCSGYKLCSPAPLHRMRKSFPPQIGFWREMSEKRERVELWKFGSAIPIHCVLMQSLYMCIVHCTLHTIIKYTFVSIVVAFTLSKKIYWFNDIMGIGMGISQQIQDGIPCWLNNNKVLQLLHKLD